MRLYNVLTSSASSLSNSFFYAATLTAFHIRIASKRWEWERTGIAVRRYLECMDDLVASRKAKTVYIAMMPSLRNQYSSTIKAHFSKQQVAVIFHTSTSGKVLQDDLVELLRMTPCDEIVGTHSTITQVVEGLRQNANLRPYIIQGDPPKRCRQWSNAEPCATFWPKNSKLSCTPAGHLAEDVNASKYGCWPYNTIAYPPGVPLAELPGRSPAPW